MKHLLTFAALLCIANQSVSQKEKYITIGVYSTQTALPFGKFAGLFGEVLHPGVEIGYGKIFSQKQKHEWFGDVKLSYFYHRFVQHGIPLYADIGYRHKIYKQLSAETSLGLGYMHSIPATEKYKLNSNGEYDNDKGVGRMQGTASLAFGLNYSLKNQHGSPVRVFAFYQQRVQMPFVKSYVPLLPYNSFLIGISKPIKKGNSTLKK